MSLRKNNKPNIEWIQQKVTQYTQELSLVELSIYKRSIVFKKLLDLYDLSYAEIEEWIYLFYKIHSMYEDVSDEDIITTIESLYPLINLEKLLEGIHVNKTNLY